MTLVKIHLWKLSSERINRLRPSLAMRARMGEILLAKSIGRGRATRLWTVKDTDTGYTLAVPEEIVEKITDECPHCESDVLWHDTKQEYFCPFCEF